MEVSQLVLSSFLDITQQSHWSSYHLWTLQYISALQNFCFQCSVITSFTFFCSCVLLWTPTHGRAKAQTYIQQLCEDTGCCPEDLPRAMNDREEWRERVRDICATSATWWWWWWWITSYNDIPSMTITNLGSSFFAHIQFIKFHKYLSERIFFFFPNHYWFILTSLLIILLYKLLHGTHLYLKGKFLKNNQRMNLNTL